MGLMPQFKFPVQEPSSDDPFYGNPAFPYGMVVLDPTTQERHFAVVINYDGEGRVRLWVCRDKRFVIMRTPEGPVPGAILMPMDADVELFCVSCKGPNDLFSSKKLCTKCTARLN